MFRPSLHGWPFPNEYTCSGPELGIGGPPPPELGLGGGLCWAALDRYLRGAPIEGPAEAPAPGDPLHAELVQRQVAALGSVRGVVQAWQGCDDGSWRDRLPFPVPFTGSDLASRTRAGWRELRRHLNTDEPVLLTLLTTADGYDRPRSIRQVLATGWDREGLRVRLSLYDPDQPGDDDIRLSFSLAGELDARITGGETVRGFFAVPYDRPRRPVARTEAFDSRSVIGLNWTIRGEAHTAVGPRHIDLVARNERGALLHFRRRNGRRWEGVDVTEAGDFGASELHSDPVAFHRLGTLHVFARSYTGDLMHFRHFRSWSLANRTEHKRIGARFQLQGRPVAVPGRRLQISVLGRDSTGGLVHYHTTPFIGWRAEQVPGDPVATDPVAARDADTLHVVALADDGRVLHWTRDHVWTMTDTDAGPGPEIRLAGRPWLDLSDDRVRIFGRTRDDDLVVLELGDDGVWQRIGLAPDLAGDPVATPGPSGLHVFAPTVDGGLVHAWWDGLEWRAEDVVASRPTLARGADGSAQVAAWGSDGGLRVFLRRDSRLRAYSWSPEADWVLDPVTDRAGSRPIGFRGAGGEPHVVLTDGSGTILHVETGDWEEPGRDTPVEEPVDTPVEEPAAETSAAEPAAADATETAEVVTAPEFDQEPVAAHEPDAHESDAHESDAHESDAHESDAHETEAYEPEAYEAEAAAPAGDDPMELAFPEPDHAESQHEPDAEATEHALGAEAEHEMEPEPDEDEVPPLPLLEDPADWEDEDSGSESAYDFDAERRMAAAEPGEPGEDEEAGEPAVAGEAGEPAVAEAEPAEKAPEDDRAAEAMIAEAGAVEEDPAGPDAEDELVWEPEQTYGDGIGSSVEEEGAGSPDDEAAESADPSADGDPSKREWTWEERRPSVSADKIEPMDLSLLDTWPKSARERRRSQAKRRSEAARKNGSDQGDD